MIESRQHVIFILKGEYSACLVRWNILYSKPKPQVLMRRVILDSFVFSTDIKILDILNWLMRYHIKKK